MLLELLACLLLFFALTFGLAWPLAARLQLDPAEKLVASAVLSLLATYLAAFAIYLLRLPAATFWLLPVLAVAGLILGRREWLATIRDPGARAILTGQLLVTGWCTGWLFFIASYSGGGWAADWYEHWDRARFFLQHWPVDTKFLGLYDLPARPPLANLVTGALLAVTREDFAHYQLFTLLLNSLAFLPAALLVRRFLPGRPETKPVRTPAAVAVFAALLMLNPSFVENATFAWTKLIAVFFILSGLYCFRRTLDAGAPRAAGPLCALALAAGLLAHYSAGPYVLLLAAAWFVLHRARWSEAGFWRQTVQLGLIGGLVLATWFAWSLAVYGPHTTLLSNSSVTVKDAQSGNQLLKIALNLRDTLVPHFLRPLDATLIAQQSPWGYWRDWFFQAYQLNLFLVFGSLGWVVLARELGRSWGPAGRRDRWFWAVFAGGVIVLGVAVHGARDTWGLAHICLQAVGVLGMAFLAARWAGLGTGWRLALAVGLGIDFLGGIALQFAAEYRTPDLPALLQGAPAALPQYNQEAVMNLAAKLEHGLVFLRDAAGVPAAFVVVLLAGLLGLALARVRLLSGRPPPTRG